METHGYAGQIFMRNMGSRTWFIGVIDTPKELMTEEEMRPIVLIPGRHQTAMMLIDPGERTDKFIGNTADGILTEPVWKTGTHRFDDLPNQIRSIAWDFVMRDVYKNLMENLNV